LVFTRDLDTDSEGDDVVALQEFLIDTNRGPEAQEPAARGATGIFGNLTQAALAEFQAANGITPATGYFGAKTRAYISRE
jgi:peptidoglycan hydrolase-like protein with peptidoglycan-binding domain